MPVPRRGESARASEDGDDRSASNGRLGVGLRQILRLVHLAWPG